MNGSGVAGGLAAGIAQGILRRKMRQQALEEQQRQAELAKPMQDLQKQLMQLQIANAKTKQAQQATQNKFLDLIMQRMGPAPGPAVAPSEEAAGIETGQPSAPVKSLLPGGSRGATGGQPGGPGGQLPPAGGGLVDMMTEMDPTVAALMKNMTGVDLLGAQRLAQQRRHDKMLESQYVSEEYQDPTGATRRRYRKKYGAPPSLQLQQGELVAPAPVERHTYEKGGKTYEVIREKRTGREITQPQEIKPIKGESSEIASKIALAKNALNYVDELESMFVNPNGSINRSTILSGNTPMGGIGEGRTARAIFLDALDARARAATGATMPESEIKNYGRMYWPNPLDSDALVKNKMQRLRSFMQDYLKIMDPTGRIKKSISGDDDLQKKYDELRQQGLSPEEAAKKLGVQ